MPKRATSPRTPVSCPCDPRMSYNACCGRLHRGEASAATAEQLMRSRYSAFALKDAEYLLRSWHPRTRPRRIGFDPGLVWTGLTVLGTTGGSPLHSAGTVHFSATFTEDGQAGRMNENSSFVRNDGDWVYLNGVII
ncbi:YchJ family protein [Actinomadura rubteroloni]|uniref:YchJ family protein n=1 Tax=Actinomadura rubteroloni TaxID=1926885 RepID=UPI00143CEF41|nr:YchJ family metal-binding protein [Actinomadura rubteroloni]